MKSNFYSPNAPSFLIRNLKKAGLAMAAIALTTFLPEASFGQYCASEATYTTDEDIGNVTFGGLNNGTGTPATNNSNSANIYTDFTTLPVVYIPYATATPVSISIINSGGTTYNTVVSVFIDYNQNQQFDVPAERVFEQAVPGGTNRVATGSITIPASALAGPTRMRVVAEETTVMPINPCGVYLWGETEDYTIGIGAPPVCTSPPNPGTISGNLNSCNTQTNSLRLVNYTLGTTLQWQSSPTGSAWTDITGATNPIYNTPILTTNTHYRVNVTCGTTTVPSPPVEVLIGTGGISTYPHTQTFDGAVVPNMPCGWQVVNTNNDSYTWKTIANNGNSAPNSVKYNYNGGIDADDWLMSPPLTFSNQNSYKVVFKYKSGSTSYNHYIQVRYGTSPTVAGMPAANTIFTDNSISSTTYLTGESSLITPPSTGTYYVGFYINTPSGAYADLFLDDIMLVEVPGCTGTPSAGTAAPGPVNYCPNSPSRLTVTGASADPRITYQWEESDDNGVTDAWANVTGGVGATTLTYQLPANLTATRYYRIKVTCGNSNLSAAGASTQVNITPSRLCYCAGVLHGGECTPFDNIDSVSVVGTTLANGSTGCSNANGPGYTKYPGSGSLTASLQAGTNYRFNVMTAGNSVISVWIDFNQNGQFETQEWYQISSSSTGGQVSFAQITIPNTARNGQTGMRIRSRGVGNPNGSTDACSPFGGGETEDYLVTITGGVVGVAEELAKAINVYPNPNNGTFKIEAGDAGNKAIKVQLINALGQVVFTDETKGAYSKEVDVTGVAAGIYILQVNADGVTASKRISIEK